MNLENYRNKDQLKAQREQFKRIFFFRVCGTGMGATACLLAEKGLDVVGADSQYFPPMSDYLKNKKIPCEDLNSIDQEFLTQFDLIVVGNVVPRTSEQARMIERSGVPFCSFPAALGAFVLEDVNVVGISGTHGKTTTTYFITQLYQNLGHRPGYFIGGVLPEGASSQLGDGKYFFIESDEYDSAYFEKYAKFQSYSINFLVVTSLEFDHADIYQSLEQIEAEFDKLARQVDKGFLLNTDYPSLKTLSESWQSSSQVLSYGLSNPQGPRDVVVRDGMTEFVLEVDGRQEQFKTNLMGDHNILNLTVAIKYALCDGQELEKIRQAVLSLKHVKRRQEVRGKFNGALIIDDFAHHPRAVAETIKAIKTQYPSKTLNVIFEPHSATARSQLFQKEFQEALSHSDRVLLCKLHRATSVPGANDLDIKKMVDELKYKVKESQLLEDSDQLIEVIKSWSNEGQIFLVLSNGTCLGFWQSPFVSTLDPVS